MDKPTPEQIEAAHKWLDPDHIDLIRRQHAISADMIEILVAATKPHACGQCMQRADVVAILRGLASKFHNEREEHKANERMFGATGFSDAALEHHGSADTCREHAEFVNKLGDEIEQGAS